MPKHGSVGGAQCVWLHATITLSPGMIFATFARIRSVVTLVRPMTSSVAMAICTSSSANTTARTSRGYSTECDGLVFQCP